MKILIYRWNAYNYLDIHQTLLAMGHEVDVIEQSLVSYDEDAAFEQRLTQVLGHGYDFVFTVNYFGCISNVCQRCHVKYVSWSCDNPLISMYHKSVFHECNYIFTFDKTNYMEFRQMGVEHIWYLPLAVASDRLDALMGDLEDECTAGRLREPLSLYQNDIAFIGSLYERNTYDKLCDTLPDYLRGYFDAAMQAQMSISGANMLEEILTPEILAQLEEHFKLKKTKDSFSDLGLIFSTTVLGFKIASIQRRRALIALSARYPVSIYTNSNTQDLLRVQYRGGVDYWSQMPLVFRTSKINLNFTIPNIKSGLPLRMWDVLGAGGFLMTNYQAEIPLYFTEGQDLVCFDGEADLIDKCGYYLAHEQERRRIARRGYEKVKKHHTYWQRLQVILETVGE